MLVFVSEHAMDYAISLGYPYGLIQLVPKVFTQADPTHVRSCSFGTNKQREVIAIGSSRVIDYAKLVSHIAEAHLVAIPTSITTDVLFTKDTAVRKEGWVYYVKSKTPDEIILNPDILLSNKTLCNYAWLELLSSFTAQLEIEDLVKNNVTVSNLTLRSFYEDLYDTNSLKIETMSELYLLLHALSKEVEICSKAETALGVEEGLEHYMSYLLENRLKERYLHGQYLYTTMLYLGYISIKNLTEGLDLRPIDVPTEVLEEIKGEAVKLLRRDVRKQ